MSKIRYHRLTPSRNCAQVQWLLAACIATAVLLMVVQLFGPLTKPHLLRDTVHLDNDSSDHDGTESRTEPVLGKPSTETFLSRPNATWPFDYHVTLEPEQCQTSSCNFTESVVICVSSAGEYLERRQAIRQTWASDRSNRVLFFFGTNATHQTNLADEAKRYNDIVQYDFEDTYKNLTVKSVAMLRFVNDHRWPELKYFIKVDDDTFVNNHNLPDGLKTIGDQRNRGLYGALQIGSRPIRAPKNKWFISRKEFAENVYPNYLAGCFYVIHVKWLGLLSAKATSVRFMYLEDAYVTGILARSLKIPRFRFPKYIVDPSLQQPAVDVVAKKFVAKHYMTPANMFKVFAFMQNSTR